MTDVTGFGLLGHGLEMARGAGLTIRLHVGGAPLLAEAEALPAPAPSRAPRHRNWASYGEAVVLPSEFSKTGGVC